MIWWKWFNRTPWGNDPTLLDIVLDVGLILFMAAILLTCC